jgi:hypothetical protein
MKQILLIFLIFLIGCSPIPVIQSSKIRSKPFGTVAFVQSGTIVKAPRDSLFACRLPTFHIGIGEIFFKRLELSGFAIPLIFTDYWDINCKTFLLQSGNDKKIFRNVSASALITTSGYFNLAGGIGPILNGGGGLIWGTSGILFGRNCEIIFSPSLNCNYFTESTGEADISPNIKYKRKTLDIQFGLLANPGHSESFELVIGCTRTFMISERKTGDCAEGFGFKKFTFQTSIRLNNPPEAKKRAFRR